jgi:hypothetical protein
MAAIRDTFLNKYRSLSLSFLLPLGKGYEPRRQVHDDARLPEANTRYEHSTSTILKGCGSSTRTRLNKLVNFFHDMLDTCCAIAPASR